MGRAWRTGQTDVAIGASGIAVSHPYEGGVDDYGNPLLVTDIAVADEIAAAADLVKGKLAGTPSRGDSRPRSTRRRFDGTCAGAVRTGRSVPTGDR